MDYEKLLRGLKRFGTSRRDICTRLLGVPAEQVRDNVVIAPWWEPPTLPELGEATLLHQGGGTGLWDIRTEAGAITYIKTGIGAPVLTEQLLALGVTGCRRIVFVGSVGALDLTIGIGDIVIPVYSVCGDGMSRYLYSDDLSLDPFGEKSYPDPALNQKLIDVAQDVCQAADVRWHLGRTFSLDTIFAQFAHIDTILSMGCNTIEMETAAAFRAAAMMKIPMVALFSVSDSTVAKKSLLSGRTEKEIAYRKQTRRELFPKIILRLLAE